MRTHIISIKYFWIQHYYIGYDGIKKINFFNFVNSCKNVHHVGNLHGLLKANHWALWKIRPIWTHTYFADSFKMLLNLYIFFHVLRTVKLNSCHMS